MIGDDQELATALRDRLDRAYVTVLEVRPGEEAEVVAACHPWPWMVVGATVRITAEVVDRLGRAPVLVIWQGAQPFGLPAHTVAGQSFAHIARSIEVALAGEVAGMSLDVGDGLSMPDGAHASCPALEALVASHPHPVFAPWWRFHSATRTLAAHGVPLRPAQLSGAGVALIPAEGG